MLSGAVRIMVRCVGIVYGVYTVVVTVAVIVAVLIVMGMVEWVLVCVG